MKNINPSKIAKISATILFIAPALFTWNVNFASAGLDRQAIDSNFDGNS